MGRELDGCLGHAYGHGIAIARYRKSVAGDDAPSMIQSGMQDEQIARRVGAARLCIELRRKRKNFSLRPGCPAAECNKRFTSRFRFTCRHGVAIMYTPWLQNATS